MKKSRKFKRKAVYNYIKLHDGQTILQKDIVEETGIGRISVGRIIKELIQTDWIRREGKRYYIVY